MVRANIKELIAHYFSMYQIRQFCQTFSPYNILRLNKVFAPSNNQFIYGERKQVRLKQKQIVYYFQSVKPDIILRFKNYRGLQSYGK